jgi:hypothetical protein
LALKAHIGVDAAAGMTPTVVVTAGHIGQERKRVILVRLAGIEPTTLGFGGQYSIH